MPGARLSRLRPSSSVFDMEETFTIRQPGWHSSSCAEQRILVSAHAAEHSRLKERVTFSPTVNNLDDDQEGLVTDGYKPWKMLASQ